MFSFWRGLENPKLVLFDDLERVVIPLVCIGVG